MKADFDKAAINYDQSFTFSKIGKAQRSQVFKYLNPILNKIKPASILEVNCGTGTDAIALAENEHNIVATDISKEMISVARQKDIEQRVNFLVKDINTIHEKSFGETFDVIFSNFGGLNCLSKNQLKTFINTSVNLLNSGGKLALVIMPRQCIWEQIYFRLKGNKEKAVRRLSKPNVEADVDGINVKTWYYNPEEILEISNNNYKTLVIKPIGLAIPPSYLEKSILTKKPLFLILKFIDKWISFTALSKFADHYLIILEKK